MARGLKPTNVEFDTELVERHIKKNRLKKVDIARFLGRNYSTLQNAFWSGRINPKMLKDIESLFGVPHGTFLIKKDEEEEEENSDGLMPAYYRPDARTPAKKKTNDRQKAYQAIWDDMERRGKL